MSNLVTPVPDKFQPGWGGQHDVGVAPTFPLVELAEALQQQYLCDQHIHPYSPSGEGSLSCPRLLSSAIPELQAIGHEPHMTAVFVDLDRPKHAPWGDGETAQRTLEAVRAQGGHFATCGIYVTRNGMRLVWALPEPIPVSAYQAWAEAFLIAVVYPLFGPGGLIQEVLVDGGSTEWHRCFRAPHVVRDGVREAHPCDLSPLVAGAKLQWAGGPSIASVPYQARLSRTTYDLNVPDELPPIPDYYWDNALRPGVDEVLLRAMRRGDILAAAGARTDTLKKALAQLALNLRFVTQDPLVLLAMAQASIEADTSDGAPTLGEAWRLACYVAEREVERAIQDKRKPILGSSYVEHIVLSAPDAPPVGAYVSGVAQPVEVREAPKLRLADAPVDRSTLPDMPTLRAPEDRVQAALVMFDKAWYVFDGAARRHQGPFDATGLYTAIRDYRPDIQGFHPKTGRAIPISNLANRYGHVVHSVINAAYGEVGWNNKERSLTIPACELDPRVVPREDPQVAKWLSLLGGPQEERLLDWIATAHRLDWATAALYIQGPSSSGKGMFEKILSGIWGGESVHFAEAIHRFNFRLTRCPLVFVDEGVRMNESISSVFRSLTAEGKHSVEAKFAGIQTLRAYLRVVICANNDNALKLSGVHSAEDLDAISARILHLSVDAAPAAYLKDLGGMSATKDWVGPEGRATRHFRWLQETRGRAVQPGHRFLIEAPRTAFHEGLLVNSPLQHRTLVAVASAAAMARGTMDVGVYPAPSTAEGPTVYINVNKLMSAWEKALPQDKDVPSNYDLTAALKTLSIDQKNSVQRVGVLTTAKPARVWQVSSRRIYEVAAENGAYDLDHLAASLGLALEITHTKEA